MTADNDNKLDRTRYRLLAGSYLPTPVLATKALTGAPVNRVPVSHPLDAVRACVQGIMYSVRGRSMISILDIRVGDGTWGNVLANHMPSTRIYGVTDSEYGPENYTRYEQIAVVDIFDPERVPAFNIWFSWVVATVPFDELRKYLIACERIAPQVPCTLLTDKYDPGVYEYMTDPYLPIVWNIADTGFYAYTWAPRAHPFSPELPLLVPLASMEPHALFEAQLHARMARYHNIDYGTNKST